MRIANSIHFGAFREVSAEGGIEEWVGKAQRLPTKIKKMGSDYYYSAVIVI